MSIGEVMVDVSSYGTATQVCYATANIYICVTNIKRSLCKIIENVTAESGPATAWLAN